MPFYGFSNQAPTAPDGDSSNKVANTAWVQEEITDLTNIDAARIADGSVNNAEFQSIPAKAPLASPVFTGTVSVTAGTNLFQFLVDGFGNVGMGYFDNSFHTHIYFDYNTGTTTHTFRVNFPGGTSIGSSIGFFGATPVSQQTAPSDVPTDAATNVAPYGFTQAQADALVAAVNAHTLALKNLGLEA